MCTGLDPEFNVWNHIAPYAQKLIANEDIAGGKSWIDEIGILAQKVIGVPGRVLALVDRMEKGNFEVRNERLENQVRRVAKAIRLLAGAVIASACLLGGVQLFLEGQYLAGGLFWAGGLILSVMVLFLNSR
jgi:hypothetical protein